MRTHVCNRRLDAEKSVSGGFLPQDSCRSPCSGTAFLVSRIFLPAKPEVTVGYRKLLADAGHRSLGSVEGVRAILHPHGKEEGFCAAVGCL